MRRMQYLMGTVILVVIAACASDTSETASSDREALIARAAEFELDTEWEQPPGDPLEHATSGFAKILCSAVFITGLDVAEAAENVGYFVSKPSERELVTDTVVDYDRREVSLTLNTGVTRTARFYGDQGCVTLAPGEDSVHFTPVAVTSSLPDAMSQPWPMGDAVSDEPLPSDVDADKVAQAVEAAFAEEDGLTAARSSGSTVRRLSRFHPRRSTWPVPVANTRS